MRFLPLLVVAVLLAPVAVADHPGSNLGLARFAGPEENLVHRVTDVDSDFARFEAAYPEFVDRLNIGATGILGLPLHALRITDESVEFDSANLATGQKLRIYLDGGHHGNEFLGVELVMYYLEEMLAKAGAGDEATLHFLATHEVYATPIINAEGNLLDTRKNANQVDVNRNYGYEFGGPGSGGMITDLNYRGPSAFSEPEVLANAEFARSIMPDLWITMHTGVAEFYWPWGWTFDKSPDREFFESIEKPFEDATNGRVDAMMAAELYLAAGATDDWGYGHLGIPTHTFEVHEDQFVPVYGNGISAQIQEQLNGLDWVVQNTRTWGAWLTLNASEGELRIHNEGWGKAVNVTLSQGGQDVLIEAIAPNETVRMPLEQGSASVQYRQLIIDAPEAKMRIVSLHDDEINGNAARTEAPGAPLALLVAALGVLAMCRKKRS